MEHARGTPRGEDLRRDLDRGYSVSSRRSGGGGGGGRGSGPRGDRFVYVDFVHLCQLNAFL